MLGYQSQTKPLTAYKEDHKPKPHNVKQIHHVNKRIKKLVLKHELVSLSTVHAWEAML